MSIAAKLQRDRIYRLSMAVGTGPSVSPLEFMRRFRTRSAPRMDPGRTYVCWELPQSCIEMSAKVIGEISKIRTEAAYRGKFTSQQQPGTATGGEWRRGQLSAPKITHVIFPVRWNIVQEHANYDRWPNNIWCLYGLVAVEPSSCGLLADITASRHSALALSCVRHVETI